MTEGYLTTKPGLNRYQPDTRFATALHFIGKRVAVTRTWVGGEEVWQGRITDVARSTSGSTAEVIVVRRDGEQTSIFLSLAQVYRIEEIEDEEDG